MKWIIKFLENNSKWVVRSFVLIWLFLILKLGYFWVYTACGWWWYINLCIIPNFHYSWTNAWLISSVFFVLSVILLIIIKFLKNKKIKILLAFIILLLWIIWKPLFYIISPDFKFYYTDERLKYMDKDYNPKNIDLYLEYMWKYCNDNIDDFLFKNLKRDSMCSGRYLYDFETVEDYKKVFDFANKNNIRELYRLTYVWAEKFWLEKIIKWYNNDTFYGYIINRDWSDKLNISFIEINTDNNKLKYILTYIKNELEIWQEKLFWTILSENEYWWKIEKQIDSKLSKIKTINTKIF